MKRKSEIYFFEDKPLFGLDIGHDTLRVMQLDVGHRRPKLKGYGSIAFDSSATKDGAIVHPELIAKAALHLFRESLVGDITTKRVAVSLPAGHAFARAVQLPKMDSDDDISEAVQTEAEQYLPGHGKNFYLDYSILREDQDGIEVFIVAMPKVIIRSYLELTHLLGLEAVLFDTSIGASARLFGLDSQSSIPSLLIDFGTSSTDITVFNDGIVALGASPFGGDDITENISRKLNTPVSEALVLKSKHGLSPGPLQKQILAAVEPSLNSLIKEIQRTFRYYEQRYDNNKPIGQIVATGGGANMPGLSDYLTERLRLPARTFDPAHYIDFGHLKHFYNADRTSYVTAAGLAVTEPAEVF